MIRTGVLVLIFGLATGCGKSRSAASWDFVETRAQGPLRSHYFVGEKTVLDGVKRVTLKVIATGTDDVPDPNEAKSVGTFYVYFDCAAGLSTGRMPSVPDHQAKVEPLVLQKQSRYWQSYGQLRSLGHDDAVSPKVIAAACG